MLRRTGSSASAECETAAQKFYWEILLPHVPEGMELYAAIRQILAEQSNGPLSQAIKEFQNTFYMRLVLDADPIKCMKDFYKSPSSRLIFAIDGPATVFEAFFYHCINEFRSMHIYDGKLCCQ